MSIAAIVTGVSCLWVDLRITERIRLWTVLSDIGFIVDAKNKATRQSRTVERFDRNDEYGG